MECDPKWDFRALMLRQLLQIPYIRDLVKRLKRNLYLRRVCSHGENAPTEAHFSQMRRRIGSESFCIIEAYLLCEVPRLIGTKLLSAVNFVQAACVYGTDLEVCSRSPDDSRRGFGNPDARLGQGKNGFYLGYRSPFLTDIEGFPLGHVMALANVNEPRMVDPLIDRLLDEEL